MSEPRWFLECTPIHDNVFDLNEVLRVACISSEVKTVTCLLNQCAAYVDVSCADYHGNTALHYVLSDASQRLHKASYDGNVSDVCRLVFMDKNDVNARDHHGCTPLHRACSSGHPQVSK